MSEFEKSITIQYSLISDRSTLSVENQKLLKSAQEASKLAYAPYSKFHVGAAAMLSNGEMVTASNKENASFPAGICAERNLLNYISDHYLGQKIIALAVSANPVEFELNEPVSLLMPPSQAPNTDVDLDAIAKAGREICAALGREPAPKVAQALKAKVS